MNALRNSFWVRCLASFLLTTIVSQICFPTLALALTSGPSQPEVQTFHAANTTDMVNMFTGDFSYNIPLFELPGPNGGYPFNLAYNSGITMDQEASWVGLGWNLNPGALNRDMRGLPDDFNGDQIVRQTDMRDNITYGFGGSAHSTMGLELAGFDPTVGLGLGMTIFYNNYNGVGYSLDQSANFSCSNLGPMNASIGIGISLNSQEGIGFNPSLGLGTRVGSIQGGFCVGMGYNSMAGITGLSLNLDALKKTSKLVSKEEYSTTIKNEKSTITRKKAISEKGKGWTIPLNYLGVAYSFATPAYVPRINTPTQARNATLSFNVGVDPVEMDMYAGVSGFFNTQYISNKTTSKSAYGYLYMQNDGARINLIDYNRSQDGQIVKNTPYLPAPILTQDIYAANAQGISAMYRPQRSDLGMIYDDKMRSQSAGGSLGSEFGIFTAAYVSFLKFGTDLTVNYSVTNSGAWTNENDFLKDNVVGAGGFSPNNPFLPNDKVFEPVYFKVYGEMSSDPITKFDAIGGYEPYRLSLDDHKAVNVFENDYGSSQEINATQFDAYFDADVNKTVRDANTKREVRLASIVPFKNKEIVNVSGTFTGNKYDDLGTDLTNTGGLAEFSISYFTDPTSTDYKTGAVSYSRNDVNRKPDHIGGFVTTNPNGMKYIYALPAYNTKHVECQFSVAVSGNQSVRTIDIPKNLNDDILYKTTATNQTNQYFNKVTTPAYAHSYLLTSVLGSDYIDADDIVGPSVGDLGYWVKFSYVKAASTYKWRTPFAGANYMRGANTTAADDIAMYMYGEKEVWHLAKAETQTHVAVFTLYNNNISTEKRNDGLSALKEVQNNAESLTTSNTSFKLKQVRLYTRDEYNVAGATGKPLITTTFTFTNALCKGIPNSDNATGKLTLTKVQFMYGDNTRGNFSYVFDYHETNPAENPNYQFQGVDRWGTYKPYDAAADQLSAPSIAQNNPYTPQFDPTYTQTANDFRAKMDNQASVWTLKSIKLPSGGKIDVTYEADDYAYVQNKTAAQITSIQGVGTKGAYQFGHDDLKIYFPLETPIPTTASTATIQKEIQKYIPDNNQLYFKVYSTFSSVSNDGMADYISGYADIETDPNLMGVDSDGSSTYKTGYITLKKSTFGPSDQYHPFALAAWLHVRTSAPYLLNIANMKADPNTTEGEKTKKIASLMSSVTEIKKIFKGIYALCDKKGFGKTIDANRSFIRLNSPDKIKIGGGVRVKQIVLSDNWSDMTAAQEKTNYYGQVYDYTIEENGAMISSGVACNEPQMGADESPLRYTEAYAQKVPARTPNRLLVEHPINEAYYPGENVGYRKVTVRSIASNYAGIANNPYEIAGGILRSGAVCYEFYTAKEFPVIEKFTCTRSHPFNLPTLIPFVGNLSLNKLTISQGFYVEVNDMHGKVKAITNYALDNTGKINPQPVDYTKYNYLSTPVYSKTGAPSNATASNNGPGDVDYYVLKNKVSVLLSDNGTVAKDSAYMGQDVEFFTDMRETETQSYSGGINFNLMLDFVTAGVVPHTNIMPSASFDYSRCRTTVSNKIVHKAGILSSVENYNQGAKVVAKHVMFDPYTGQPLLTVVNNNFEDPVYQYKLPAHLVNEYKRIGGKYVSQELKIDVPLTLSSGLEYNYSIPYKYVPQGDLFQKGDKVFVSQYNSGAALVKRYPAVITAISSDAANLYGKVTILKAGADITSGATYRLEMYDPVYDNNYDETAYSVTSLQDPTVNRTDKNCSVNYTYPIKSQVCDNSIKVASNSFNNLISYINQYISTDYYTFRFPLYIYDPNRKIGNEYGVWSFVTPASPFFPFIKYNSTGTFWFSTTQTVYAPEFPVETTPTASSRHFDACFYYADGTAVNFDQVSLLQNPVFTGDVFVPSLPGISINPLSATPPLAYDENEHTDPAISNNGNLFYSQWRLNVLLKNGTTSTVYLLFHAFRNTELVPAELDDSGKRLLRGEIFLDYLSRTNAIFCKDTVLLTTGTINPAFKNLSKILNVSATTFSEFRPLDNNSAVNKDVTTARLVGFDQLIAYLNGSAGTFRPKESWTYLDERSQTVSVNTRTDGTFGDVPFFKFNSPLCEGCPARWKRVVKFTDYFPNGTPQEEQDVLGNKSAVLFGYSGAQVTAVAANTSVYEIGFESFEDYPNPNSTVNAPSLQSYYVGKNNLNFYDYFTNKAMDAFANYNIVSANKNMLIIDKPYNKNISVISADVDGQDIVTGTSISGRYGIQLIQAYPGDASKTILVLNTTQLDNATPWTGTGKFKLQQSTRLLDRTTMSSSSYAPYITNGLAHSGKNCLRVAVPTIFEQRRLVLTPGKKMVFEAWAMRGLPNANSGVRFYDNTGALITGSNVDFGWTSTVVEGWTKIYGEFTVPANAESLGIYLVGGSDQSGSYSSYFDDIRVYPAESNMVSYVYDRSNFRLSSILDNNNFATYYYYDPSGSLYLTKKETERGIMTLQEVQSQIKGQ